MRLVVRTFASAMWIAALGIAPVGIATAQATKAPGGGSGAALAPGAPAAGAPKPAVGRKVRSKTPDPRMVPVLLAQGRAALAAEAFKPARDAYMDVLAI